MRQIFYLLMAMVTVSLTVAFFSWMTQPPVGPPKCDCGLPLWQSPTTGKYGNWCGEPEQHEARGFPVTKITLGINKVEILKGEE